MNKFKFVFENDPQVQIKTKDFLDNYNRLPNNYQPKIGYNSLIQSVILKELINLMGATLADIDKELKTKFSRIKFLESRLL